MDEGLPRSASPPPTSVSISPRLMTQCLFHFPPARRETLAEPLSLTRLEPAPRSPLFGSASSLGPVFFLHSRALAGILLSQLTRVPAACCLTRSSAPALGV